MTSTLTTRAEQITFLTDNLGLMSDADKGQIEATLALGDSLPDIVIKSLYDGVMPQLEAALKGKADKVKVADKAKELFVEAFEDTPVDTTLVQSGFVKLVGPDNTIQLIDYEGVSAGQLVGYIQKVLKELKEKCQVEAQTLINPPVKVPKKKTSGGARRKAGEADEWVINTVEKAQAQYKTGVWASKADIEQKTTFKEQMKTYGVGDADPRDASRTLDKDLVKYQYKAIIRADNIQDEEDSTTRCRGAVSFKAARYGSAYATNKGFKGGVMAQCSATGNTGGGGYCVKCAVKKTDYFNTENKYKKADISWCEAWVDEGIFQKIE
tara:strand:- start:41 stop:1012 length:972 start_codon:yes stop_codon:yes gene_type:complete